MEAVKPVPLILVIVAVLPWSGDKVTEAAKTGLAVMKITARESVVSNNNVDTIFFLCIVVLIIFPLFTQYSLPTH